MIDFSHQVLSRREKHAWTLSAEDVWLQGRGLFGGLVSRAAAIAMGSDLDDPEKSLRSLTVHFCGPAPTGDLALTTELVRNGSRVATMTARIARPEDALAPVTIFSASFARPRESAIDYMTAEIPKVKAPIDSLRLSPEIPGIPRFIRNFDVRFATDAIPFFGGGESEFAAWIRPVDPVAFEAGLAVALLDVLPPAVACRMASPRPIASVDFTVLLFESFAEPMPLPEDGFVLVHVTSRWAGHGYAEELRDLWLPDGRLVGQCRQLIALL